jgi:hypothetical protein
MWYIIIGILLVIFIDYYTSNMGDDVKLTNSERVITAFIWPIVLVLFLIEFWKQFNDDETRDN